jgi:hypothetical protein
VSKCEQRGLRIELFYTPTAIPQYTRQIFARSAWPRGFILTLPPPRRERSDRPGGGGAGPGDLEEHDADGEHDRADGEHELGEPVRRYCENNPAAAVPEVLGRFDLPPEMAGDVRDVLEADG